MNSNKNIIYINTECFGTDAEDQVRVELNSFWHDQKISDQANNYQTSSFSSSETVKYGGPNSSNPDGNARLKHVSSDPIQVNDNVRPTVNQTVQFYADEGYTDEEWKDYILSIVQTGSLFTDLSHQINLQLTLAEEAELNYAPYDTITVTPEYNFYVKEYEAKSFTSRISENDLPSLYSYSTLKENPDVPAAQNILGNGKFKNELASLLDSEKTSANYFKNFSKLMGQGSATNTLQNMYLSTANVNKMMESNEKKFVFPMYTDILFTTDNRAQSTLLFENSNMSSELVKGLSENKAMSMSGFVAQDSTLLVTSAKVYDLFAWLEEFSNNGPTPLLPNSFFLGAPNIDIQTATGEASVFSQQMHATILAGTLREYATDKYLDFSDVLSGPIRNAETVAYRIAKYKGDPSANPIKNIWIFNSLETDVLNFIDTQVKYGSGYSYEVYAYNFVIGTEYSYNNLSISKQVADDCIQLIDTKSNQPVEQKIKYKVDQNPITRGTTYIPVDKNPNYIAEVDIVSKPLYRIVEALVYTKTFKMLDSPPLAPEVKIHPFIGVKDKIKISFEASLGTETTLPITIEDTDKSLFDEIRSARDLVPGDPIEYSSDDYPVIYEIYRTTKKPKSYEDFSGKLRVKIDLRRGKLLNSAAGASGAYNDKIVQNQRYYYTIRCFDVHGNISNPSAIHEIELVEDKGAVYLVHNVIELDISKPYMVSKPMKRLLYLVPNIAQSLINEEKSKLSQLSSAKDLRNIITLGMQEESVWGKKFKMRLVSNKTGRKIDINLNFTIEHVRSAVENE